MVAPVAAASRAAVARLARQVRAVARRVRRLEGHRRRIGFRARREPIDTDVRGEPWWTEVGENED